jgi:outer membrane receptor protein involved in Fe transport
VPQEETPPKFKISPRLGLAHPITETTVFYFAYGHFFQSPRYYDLYRNSDLQDILANDALVGNPGLDPEETVSFEAGFKQQIGNDYSIELTAYYKDIENLISSFYYFSGRDYTIFINADYGRVKGVDISLNKRYSKYFGGFLNYTFMTAEGNESDPTEGYSQYREEDAHLKPNRNFYLDFDRRHSINLNLGINFPEQFGPEIFGLYPFQYINMNFLYTASSGLPYTPSSRDPEATVLPEKNSARKGWTSQLDMRISKLFFIWKTKLDLYLRIDNVFDTINVLRVWTRTGDPWDQGPTSNYSKDRQANPENVDKPRIIRAGIILRY